MSSEYVFEVGDKPNADTMLRRLNDVCGHFPGYADFLEFLLKDRDLLERAIRALVLIATILYSHDNMPLRLELQYGKNTKDATFNTSVALYISIWVFTGTTMIGSNNTLLMFKNSNEYQDRELYPRMKDFIRLLMFFFPKLQIGGGKTKKQKDRNLLTRNIRQTKDQYVAYLRGRNIYSLAYVKQISSRPYPAGYHQHCTGLRLPQALMACLIFPNALEAFMEYREYRNSPGLRILPEEAWTEEYIYNEIVRHMMTPVPRTMPLYSGKPAYSHGDTPSAPDDRTTGNGDAGRRQGRGSSTSTGTGTAKSTGTNTFKPNFSAADLDSSKMAEGMPKQPHKPGTPSSWLEKLNPFRGNSEAMEPYKPPEGGEGPVEIHEPTESTAPSHKVARRTATPRGMEESTHTYNKRTMTQAGLDQHVTFGEEGRFLVDVGDEDETASQLENEAYDNSPPPLEVVVPEAMDDGENGAADAGRDLLWEDDADGGQIDNNTNVIDDIDDIDDTPD